MTAAAVAAPADLEPIWEHYSADHRPISLTSLGNNGGFSGARLWRVESRLGSWCLRAWPRESPSERQLRLIHDTLRRVAAGGMHVIPAPVPTLGGGTYVRHASRLWELTGWMPGVADYHARPSLERLVSAMQALARFHLIAASTHNLDPVAVSSTLQRRVRELQAFCTGPAASELRRRVPDGRWPDMDQRAVRVLTLLEKQRATLRSLLDLPLSPVTQQPVIRDIWHDHVLFQGDEVSGIIDFGAMSVDTVAVDIARLLGSLVDGDELAWREGLRAYRELRPISLAQQELLVTLDQTGVFAGALVWLRWHYLERRTFENRSGVLSRLDHFLSRLEAMDRPRPRVRPLSTSSVA